MAIYQVTETRTGADIISGNQLPLETITYLPNTNNIMVFVNRSLYVSRVDYTEPSSTRIDFEAGSIPDSDDEIYVVSGASTTNVLNPAFSGTTIRSWRFSGTGASTYNILGADTDLPEAYIVRVDGVDLEPTLNYTVDSDAGTISFTDDLGNPETYDSSQRINVLGIGQVVNPVIENSFVNISEVTVNTVLDADTSGTSSYTTVDALTFTLPAWGDCVDGWTHEIIVGDSTQTHTLAPVGADTLRDSATGIDGDASIVRTPVSGVFAIVGNAVTP